jgi:hypothetical protein
MDWDIIVVLAKEAKMRVLGVLLLAGSALLLPPAWASGQHARTSLASVQTVPVPVLPAPASVQSTQATVQSAPASVPSAQAPSTLALPLQRVGTISELMVDMIYPTSDAVFYITTREPKDEAGWNELRGKTLMLAESANLLLMPGRARDQDRWMADSKLLLDAGAAAFRAAKRKDVDALSALSDQLYQSCVTCHQHYRPNYGRRP